MEQQIKPKKIDFGTKRHTQNISFWFMLMMLNFFGENINNLETQRLYYMLVRKFV
jgi:hypothetical protein